MKEIKLTKGKVALVDDDDFEHLSQFKWHTQQNGYACRVVKINGKRKGIVMHRVIMNTPDGMETDHIDHNKLNNQKSNLRVCDRLQNLRNRRKHRNSKHSKYKGVFVIKHKKGYQYYTAKLWFKGRQFAKNFPFTPEGELAAARQYNEFAKTYFGDYANLNPV